jgi:hypothetical protein
MVAARMVPTLDIPTRDRAVAASSNASAVGVLMLYSRLGGGLRHPALASFALGTVVFGYFRDYVERFGLLLV